MSGGGENNGVFLEEIELLVFTIMGVRMGVDTAQVAAMLKPEDAARQGLVATALHERLHFKGIEVRYKDPHVLLIRGEVKPRGIIIDHPDEIASVKIDSIRPMPDIIASSCREKALWGAVLRDEGIIFLLDFYKMADPEGPYPCENRPGKDNGSA